MCRYSSLEIDGTVHQISAKDDLSHVRPVFERDMKNALLILESSNSSIGKQLSELKAQRQALSGFQESNRKAREQSSRACAKLQTTQRRLRQSRDLAVRYQ